MAATMQWSLLGIVAICISSPGNNDCIGFEQFSFGLETVAWYNEFKKRGYKIGGIWSWATPALILIDTDIIKDVLLKDFNFFVDRDFFHNPKYDPKNESIFVAEKEEWKNLRQKLTPVFTSAKMKMMFKTVVKCSDQMLEVMNNAFIKGDDIEVKEIAALFTTDVIGCIAFGLEFESFKDPDTKFRKIGKEIFRPTIMSRITLLLSRICPKFAQSIGLSNIPRVVTEFFTQVVTDNVKYRKDNNVSKPDITQLLMDLHEATKDQKDGFTFDDLIGNIIVFFIAGFDTSSTTIHFALYELAQNKEIQDRARKEIQTVLAKYNGELNYESFQEMIFLRQVIDETLRKYPVVQTFARIATDNYTFKNTNYTIAKGMTVLIPVFALARDPDHFPEPQKFDPDRFSPENKASIITFAYLPFGEGPRNCIGKRFGIMQSAIGVIQILKNYKVSISPKTKMPLTLKHGIFLMQTNETLYLKLQKC
ncbi:probable cytochrome P450 6a21 isoform X2 [Anthonomus grandis grandis]|uniref:probable cytochrome P450 6a21 isoform X2 n=1 Tax=Anthonomus grandis grandis TaxID=2921223 RepID=UPI0021655664|nr:probable cytochrome P450 6a21 isoform X2 [Anthonomus grandis grandis]